MAYQSHLDFDETYAWVNFVKTLINAKQGEKFTWYGFEKRKIVFVKVDKWNVLILSQPLTLKGEVHYESNIRFFEVEVMSHATIEKHLHIYERSNSVNPDKHKQVYRCTDPDCNHYTQAQYILGKRVKCSKCRQPFVTYKEQFQKNNKRLVCELCSKLKRATVLKESTDIIHEIFKDIDKDEAKEDAEFLDKLRLGD